MTGIEPALSAWEADVIPLHYIRNIRKLIRKCASYVTLRLPAGSFLL